MIPARASSGVVSAFLSTAALAAGAQAPPGVATPAAGTLEEITVTALRRSERLQDTPNAITAFDRATLEAAGIRRANDFAALTPNLRFSDDQEVGASTITIRGVTQNRGTGEPPVAFVVDGVAYNSSLLSTQELYDLDQVEVLRGPQGAVYGTNAIGGAIAIRTRAPGPEPEALLRAAVAEGGERRAGGALGGPLAGERVLGRVAFDWSDRDGQLRNAGLGGALVDFRRAASARGRVLVRASESLELDLRAQYAEQEGGSGYFRPWSTSPFLGNAPFTIQSNRVGVSFVDFAEATAKLDWRVGGTTLTSISSYNRTRSGNDQDLDQTDREFLNIVVDDDADTFVQELRAVSAAAGRVRWLGGLYFQHQRRERSLQTFLNVGGFAPGQVLFVQVPAAAQDARNESRALFGSLDWDLAEALTLTLAGRYERNPRADRTQGLERTFAKFQPKAQLGWRPRSGVLAYATWSVGFRPGGFNNLAPGSEFPTGYASESLDNYELGTKLEWGGGRWRLNAAAFHIDYRDQQFFLFDARGTQAFVNAPSSWIRGGELELEARLGGGLVVRAGAGWTDSEIESFREIPGLVVPARDIVGRRVPNAPVSSLLLTLEHRLPLGGGRLALVSRADLQRRGTTYFTLDNLDRQDAYSLLDLRATLEGERWQVAAFARNVTDREYQEWFFAARFVGLPTDISWPSPPRQLGLEARWRY